MRPMNNIAFLTVMLASNLILQAQAPASLQGTVLDATGAAVPNASIEIRNLENNRKSSIVSGDDGGYLFARVEPGRYEVTASKAGFKKFVRESVHVLVGTPLLVDIALEVGSIDERVTVTAEVLDTVNVQDAARGNAMREEEIKRLPFLARNPVNLLTLQPGVVFTGGTDTDLLFLGSATGLDPRDGVVNGIRGNQSNITVDGIDANDWENQSAFTSAIPLTLDSLQEFRVTTASATGVQGVAGGAQVNLVTKQGTNAFHGNMRWFHRNTATAANSFFNNRIGLATPKLIRNIGGASVGGPVRSNRVFFFADFERRVDARESSELRVVPRESLRSGVINYRNAAGGIATLSPERFRDLDPARIGVNPAMLRYLGRYPAANDATAGDGLNTGGYRFNAPVQVDANLYTLRLDANITSDGRHTVFARGSLGDILADQRAAQLPGQDPASRLVNNSRGFALNYTAQLSSTLVTSARWGLSRQGIRNTGLQAARIRPANSVSANLNEVFPTVSASGRVVPVHDLRDDLTWQRGRHSLQLGASVRIVRNDRFNFTPAFPIYQMFQSDCAGQCREIANALAADPNPNIRPATPGQISDNTVLLAGLITNVQATFLADPATASFLPSGSPQLRAFAENGFEGYVQDSWRVRPNLSFTVGLRYSYYTPIWDTTGSQVRPNVNVQDYWNRRQADMVSGVPADRTAPLAWIPAGRANDAPAWYGPDRNNFAPRASLVWSPAFENSLGRALFGAAGKSSVRAGFGIYFDRIGGALATRTDDFGSPGVATTLSTVAGQVNFANGRRFSGDCSGAGCLGAPPVTEFLTPPASAAFPFTPSLPGRASGFMVDDRLRHPYSMQFSLSIQREITRSTVIDIGYVGVQGRQLLAKLNMAQFYGNLLDPASGQTLWQAQSQIADLIGPNPAAPRIDPRNTAAVGAIGAIPFFENLMPNLPGFTNNAGLTPTQAFYVFQASQAPNWARTFPPLDVGLTPGRSPWSRTVDPEQDGWVLFPKQFRALPTWTNAGASSFHSLQFGIRRTAGPLLAGFNYVLSKAIDNGSQPENNGSNLTGMIPNAFSTGAARAVSAFDLRHNLNAHWVLQLPFGRGARFGSQMPAALNAILGGWSSTGVLRAYSGFPVYVNNGAGRATDELLGGPATLSTPLHIDIQKNGQAGFPNLFRDPAAAFTSVVPTGPGGVGNTNPFYGPSYVTFDLGVNKRFRAPWEGHAFEFRATAFNALNNVNFAAPSVGLFDTAATFGRITSTVGQRGGARELEFALRYEF